MNRYLDVIRKYAVFQGRARRADYWTFVIGNFLIGFLLSSIERVSGLNPGSDQSVLASLYGLFVLVPGIAVTARRLHDINRSAYWCCLAFVPILGWVVLLFFMVQEGDTGENPYGPRPQ